MKKALIYLVLLAVVGAAGYFGYREYKEQRTSVWSFIPSNSIMVFQPKAFAAFWDDVEEKKILKNLANLPMMDTTLSVIRSIDSLSNGQFLKTFDNGNLLISFHQKSVESLSSLFILEVENLDQHQIFGAFATSLVEDWGLSRGERLYNGHSITEFTHEDFELAYIFHKNYLIASFTPVLVEDAIRMLDDGESNPYLEGENVIAEINQSTIGSGRCFINTNLLNKFAGVFAHPVNMDTTPLQRLAYLMYLDISISDEKIDFSGFALTDSSSVNYLAAFDGIRGVGFEMKSVIPAQSSFVIHSSIDDMSKWHKGLKTYWRKHYPAQLTMIGEMENKYDFDINQFYEFMSDEIGLFVIEANGRKQYEQIFCVKHSDTFLAEQFFETLSKQADTASVHFEETYSNRIIGHVAIDEIPSRIFGAAYKGFPTSFYFVDQNYIFIGNSQHALEVLIDDVDAENTWQKSLATYDFLENTNEDANYSIYFKTAGIYDLLGDKLNDHWAQYFEEFKPIFSQMEYGAVQFTNVDDKYYTNISLQHPGELITQTRSESFNNQQVLTLSDSITSKPFAVKNHNDRSLEMMVQTASDTIYLVDANQDIALKIPLTGQLSSPIYQLDYYKNGKLQYLFALANDVHLIDRTGVYIPGYPKKVTSSDEITKLSLIDYDKSRNYRILAATKSGAHYMMDKTGKLLNGWNPKRLKGTAVSPPRFLRVRSKDFLLFSQQNGLFYALSRKGEVRKGFPIDLKGAVSGEFFIKKGSNSKNTLISSVTALGELVTFNLEGSITKREQLYRGDENEHFKLVKERSGGDFLLAKIGASQITLFNKAQEEQFSVKKPSDALDFQYYSFGNNRKILVIIDQQNQRSYLYNQEGRLLHQKALDSGYELALIYHETRSELELTCTFGNKLQSTILPY